MCAAKSTLSILIDYVQLLGPGLRSRTGTRNIFPVSMAEKKQLIMPALQLGLLDPKGLPVAGAEVAHKVVDPFGMPSNALLTRWKESEGLPID